MPRSLPGPSVHHATLRFAREAAESPRAHVVRLGCGVELQASAAPEWGGVADRANPEELLIAALASCHLLAFLAVAERDGWEVESYDDVAEGLLGVNAEGRRAVLRVTLRPSVRFAGERQPTPEARARLHQSAHRGCFIAASVRAEVVVQPRE